MPCISALRSVSAAKEPAFNPHHPTVRNEAWISGRRMHATRAIDCPYHPGPRMADSTPQSDSSRTPLAAVCALTFACSIGTGVVWAGISFIAKNDYKFSEANVLWLYVALGATYVIGSLSAGFGLRRVEARLPHRRVLACVLICAASACLMLRFSSSAWMLCTVAIAVNIVTSWLWPIVESYVTAGKHGAAMRNALGVWNITWTTAVLASLLLMAPLVGQHAKTSLEGTSVMYLLALASLRWFPPRPASHGRPDDGDEENVDRREYPHLLRSARMLLLSSYVLNAAMSPLLPFLITRVGVSDPWSTPVAAIWTAARVLIVAIMWRANFWHGRWGTLLVAAISMAAGFSLIVASNHLAVLVVGLLLLGSGMAVVYFATIYYTMTVGHADVDASGGFEALIGLGYTIGPIIGLLGLQFKDEFAHIRLGPNGGVIIAMLMLMSLAYVLAMRPYMSARRIRSPSP